MGMGGMPGMGPNPNMFMTGMGVPPVGMGGLPGMGGMGGMGMGGPFATN